MYETTTFGEMDGAAVQKFILRNSHGLELHMTDFGAIVLAVLVPDRAGAIQNVNLGFEDLAGYRQRHPYFGSTVGRFANRIARGAFTLDGVEYSLATNNPPNHLHGGDVGFDRYLWEAEVVESEQETAIQFSRTSLDGEEGYPGNLRVTVTYSLTDDNRLVIDYRAVTDRPTVLNLTNHNYWNLAGAGNGKVLDHRLQLPSEQFVPVDDQLIPTGQLLSVADTPLDFRQAMPLGARVNEIDADPVGYDHCFVVPGEPGQLRMAARVEEPSSGRCMEVWTTQPGIQLYTGNFLDGSACCGGFAQHEAFCLETQHFPDSPNQPNFPSTRLDPGQTFRSRTEHRFTTS